jgi:DNA-directed RNA polymerase alpha subunit
MDDDETVRKLVHAMRLDQFDLTTRTANCFERKNLTTIGQLASLNPAAVSAWPNAGPKTLTEIESILSSVGFRLGEGTESVGEISESEVITNGNATEDERSERRALADAIELDRFDLSTRTANCLINQQIAKVGQLLSLTPFDILKWPNAGQKTLQEIRFILGSIGLSLRNDNEPAGKIDHGKLEELLLPPVPEQSANLLMLADAASGVQVRLVSQIETFPISVRAQNVLIQGRVQYLGELAQLTKKDLLRIKTCGTNTVDELSALLKSQYLSLGLLIPDWSRKRAVELSKSMSAEIAREARARSGQLLAQVGTNPTCLEEELRRIAEILDTGRNIPLLMSLWGWNGSDPRVLDSVGKEYGLTRERVRQLAARAIKRLKRHKFDTPYLNAAIQQLRKEIPAVDTSLIDRLRDQAITRSSFSVWGIELAAELLGVHWGLTHVVVNGIKIVVATGDQHKLAKSFVALRRKTSELGCVNIQSLCSEIQIEEARTNTVRRFLDASSAVDWLDDAKEWMYLSNTARNRLFNLCEKVLGVCPSIGIGELRRAVGKSRRLAMAPPQRILASFVSREGLGTIQGSKIVAIPSMGKAPTPDSAEGKMLAVLDEFGPIMDGEDMAEKCIAAGMNATTFYIYRMISPVVSSLGRGVYCKVGSDVPPGVVEAILGRRRAIPRVSDHGWTPKGLLWFGTELSRMILTAGSIRLVSFVSDLVQGEWTVRLPDGGEYGTVTCRDSFIWTFRKAFNVLGAEPSDLMVLEFDIKARIVLVRVGGPGLFEAVQEPEADVEILEEADNIESGSADAQHWEPS